MERSLIGSHLLHAAASIFSTESLPRSPAGVEERSSERTARSVGEFEWTALEQGPVCCSVSRGVLVDVTAEEEGAGGAGGAGQVRGGKVGSI